MLVIPVVDIRHGVAVRAIAGDRANYRPLVTPLSASSEPLTVTNGLMALYPFPVIYIADLDGIEGRGVNAGIVEKIAGAWPETEVWLDCGARADADVAAHLGNSRVRVVIGSETRIAAEALGGLVARFGTRIVLSLDFRAEGFVGDHGILSTPTCWPGDVIVMTLARVGANAGPDLARIRSVRAAKPSAKVYAAGGVRDASDLDAVTQAGAAGALVSTALHAQTITAGDLR